MLASVNSFSVTIVLVYLAVVTYLGWLGYKRTHSASDYLLAGRRAHPVVMALSYGATFISTSAIVGFGGVAGNYGMSLLWLVFLNIFVGIFIAFTVLGGRTRRIGQALDAHTFPELLGRRFESKGIQVFAGLVIFSLMPLYAAAVLKGGVEFATTAFQTDYASTLAVLTIFTAVYVVLGGLKGVMYTDAFQGAIMMVVMLVLLIASYRWAGGLVAGHRALSDLTPLVPENLQAIGHRGWTAFPEFGFGETRYNLWWIVVTTITLGVGIGVLAQPQLVVRFMTVKSQHELNRAVGLGGLFILLIPGTAYVTGALSNVYFSRHGEPIPGRVVRMLDESKGQAIIQPMARTEGGWADAGKPIPALLDPSPAPAGAASGAPSVAGRTISIVYAKGVIDQVMPTFITKSMPAWFGTLFLVTLLAAAMSTLSGQFHALGTAMSRDVIEQFWPGARPRAILLTKLSIVLGIAIAWLIAWGVANNARSEAIIARFTAIFFGVCTATFLPAYFGGLFSKRITKAGAIASMAVGFAASAFWLVLVKMPEAEQLGLATRITGGKPSILANYPNWPVVDSLLIALPLSLLTALVVSTFTRSASPAVLKACFASEPKASES